MTLALIGFGITCLLELALFLPGIWRARHVLSFVVLVLVSVASGMLFAAQPSAWGGLILVAGLYRLFNMMRIIQGRMQPQYLRRVTFRTAISLQLFQLLCLVAWLCTTSLAVTASLGWTLIACLQLLFAGVTWRQLHVQKKQLAMPIATDVQNTGKLPTVTVCIPARNETTDLESCLRALLASNYPKLEILVLDDCSQNRRTSDIIRSFAHDGVRFIKGAEPTQTWLAKNQAYQRLSEEANGDILLFCGVDLRVETNSLRAVIDVMQQQQWDMLSIMPENKMPSTGSRLPQLLLQPVRYAWELLLPRNFLKQPAALSTCWLIRRTALTKAGGFAAVSRSVIPERYFAKVTAKTKHYAFLASNATTSISTSKLASEQYDTALRTRYPELHRRPELVFWLLIVELFGFVLPPMIIIGALALQAWPVVVLSIVTTFMAAEMYAQLVSITYHRNQTWSVALAPAAALLDIWILHRAMYQYEFSEVLWKGRNVCLPIMHVEPHLPHIDAK